MEPEGISSEIILKPVYTGKTIRLFISYSTEDKEIAGSIKQYLEAFGLEVFLAHEDLEPSVEWQTEIEQNLRWCDILLPLLTEQYRESNWTNQETGMAYALGKLVVPIKISIDPYGFIARYQALKFEPSKPNTSCKKIIDVIASKEQFLEPVKDCIIRSFVNSSSYIEANKRSKMLSDFAPFNINQCNEIIRAYIYNQQIREGFSSNPFIKDFYEKNKEVISPKFRTIFETTIRNQIRGL